MSRGSPSQLTSDLFLSGAISFYQTEVDNHLVTIIGESHLLGYQECSSVPSSTVANYIFNYVSKFPETKVLLEYLPGLKEWSPLLGSKNMADIYKILSDKKLKDKMIGFDLRSLFLRPRDQEVLYHQSHLLEDLDEKTITGVFVWAIPIAIIPKLEENIKTIGNKDQAKYLRSFLEDLDKHAHSIAETIQKQWTADSKKSSIRAIQHLWSKVSDFAIVYEVFKQAESGSVIVLCGEKHAENLRSIFPNPVFQSITKNPKQCINLRDSLTKL